MTSKSLSIFAILTLCTQIACAQTQSSRVLERVEHQHITSELRKESASDKQVHIITDGHRGVADPTRPELITLPDGKKKYVMGFSGQQIMMVDSLKELIHGGIKPVHAVNLINAFGFPYGNEIDPETGREIGYDFDSSTWDVSLFKFKNNSGETKLKVLAGAMGDDESGKPLLNRDGHNNTRQRLFFDAEFIKLAGTNEFTLHASKPKAILNAGKPVDGNWVQTNAQGKVIFNHGYGGEPITFLNGDLYIDERGYVPFLHEMVVEQRNIKDPRAPGGEWKIPYRTAIVLTYLDKTLSKVMEPAKIIFDVYKPDGSIWAAAQRPTAGPLVEGPHIEVRANGKPVESLAEMKALRKKKTRIDYQMLFSAGEFFGHYGSYMAISKGNFNSFKPVLDEKNELLDITAPLRVLFTWIGRPVSFHVDGKEYLLLHGVDRSSLPEGIKLDQLPQGHEWQYFKRQEIVVPVERYLENGVEKIRLKDEAGLIEYLKKFTPRKVSKVPTVLFQAA